MHTNTHRHRQTDGQTAQTDRQTHRQTDTHTHTKQCKVFILSHFYILVISTNSQCTFTCKCSAVAEYLHAHWELALWISTGYLVCPFKTIYIWFSFVQWPWASQYWGCPHFIALEVRWNYFFCSSVIHLRYSVDVASGWVGGWVGGGGGVEKEGILSACTLRWWAILATIVAIGEKMPKRHSITKSGQPAVYFVS